MIDALLAEIGYETAGRTGLIFILLTVLIGGWTAWRVDRRGRKAGVRRGRSWLCRCPRRGRAFLAISPCSEPLSRPGTIWSTSPSCSPSRHRLPRAARPARGRSSIPGCSGAAAGLEAVR